MAHQVKVYSTPTCPWCKNNFSQAVSKDGENLKVLDISELILASVGT